MRQKNEVKRNHDKPKPKLKLPFPASIVTQATNLQIYKHIQQDEDKLRSIQNWA